MKKWRDEDKPSFKGKNTSNDFNSKPSYGKGAGNDMRKKSDKPFEKREGTRDDSSKKPFSRAKSSDSKPSYGTNKDTRRSFDKPSEKRSDKPFEKREGTRDDSSKKPFSRAKSSDSKPSYGANKDTRRSFDKPSEKRSDKPFEKREGTREDSSKKPFSRAKSSDSKPSYGANKDTRRSFDKPSDRRNERSERLFDKVESSRDDAMGRKSFGRVKSSDSKSSYSANKDTRKSFDKPSDRRNERSERPSDRRTDSGAKKPFKVSTKTSDFGSNPPYEKVEGRNPPRKFEDKPSDRRSERPFEKRENTRGSSKLFEKRENTRSERPFEKREDTRGRKPFEKKNDEHYVSSEKTKKNGLATDNEYIAEEGTLRLNKYVANAGVSSRRKADELIQHGFVKVNGEVIKEMGYRVKPTDEIRFKDDVLKIESKKVYVLLNKPKNVITTASDEKGRKTVMDIVADACEERIYPVGRLDRETTGLLLLTNDGDLAKRLSHPSYEVKKIYHVILDKPLTLQDLEKIRDGLTLEDGQAPVDKLEYAENDISKQGLVITIHIGRNRIVRRIFAHLGYTVVKLDRIYYGGLTKKNLSRGFFRHLNAQEVIMLKHFI